MEYVSQDDESIRNAILRYDVQHPCVNDKEMSLWKELGISSWPTLAVISPSGRLIATLPGISFDHSLIEPLFTEMRLEICQPCRRCMIISRIQTDSVDRRCDSTALPSVWKISLLRSPSL